MTTTLSSSLLLNTTSSSGSGSVDVDEKEGGSDFGNSWSVSQKMIASCVSLCTNHLCGTGIRDLNLGGSVLCSNTSFTHCTTSTTEYTNQHYKAQTKLTTADTLHLFTLCTFKGCKLYSGSGAAIYYYQILAAMEIESCSFDSCFSQLGAGAVTFVESREVPQPLIISSSSFVNCSTDLGDAGSFDIWYPKTLSISDCVFLDSRSKKEGGAGIIYYPTDPTSNLSFSNCLFRNCTTSDTKYGGGGALSLFECSYILFASVSFRECVAAKGFGPDIYFFQSSPTISLSTVSNCDSTSAPKTYRLWPPNLTEDDVLPDPTETSTILSLINEPATSTTTEIVVKLDKTVKGTLLVLVSNSKGTARTDATKAPNIGRVLLFSVQSSKSGRCTASIGETDLLQLPLEDYKLVAASLPNHAFSFSDVFIKSPTLTSAKCILDNTNTHALLIVEGSDLVDEPFKLTLQNGSILEASFSDNQATIDLGVIGEFGMDGESNVYDHEWKEEERCIDCARLTNIEVSELNPTNTEVTLSFSSQLLKANQVYEITIKPKDGGEEIVIKLTTDNSGLLADQTVKLYPSNGNVEGWKNLIEFGEEYEVIDVSAKTGPSTDPDSSDVHDTSISVVASSSTDAKSAALPLSSTPSSSLLFDHKYTITAITNGSEAGIIDGTPSFTTRSTPTLTSLSCKLKVGDAKTAEVSISGSDIPDGLYNLVLKNTVSTKETELPMKIVDSSGKLEIEVFSSSPLEYGAKYEVLSLWSSLLTVALPTDATKRLLEVPEAPARVRSVSCVLADDLKTHVEVVICGENLPMGKKVSVKVLEVDSLGSTIGSEIGLPSATIASKSRTEGISIEVYEVTNPSLEYGKTYEVTSLTISDTTSWIVDECVRFSVPCEPVRVKNAGCSTDQPTTTVVWISGSGFMKDETYTLTLSGKLTADPASTDVHDTSISVVASSSTDAKSAALPLSSTPSSSLLFDHKYTITGITNGSEAGIIDGKPSFTTRSTPTLTSLSCKLKVGDAKTAEISISGSDIPDGLYRLVLKNIVSSKETELKIEIVDSEGKVEVEIFSSSTLEYGAEYEVLSLWTSSVAVALPTDATKRLLEVPQAPARVTSVSCVLAEDLKTHVEVVICGENLPMGKKLSVKVLEVDSLGSTIGSEIGLPSATIASKSRTEEISIEVYDADEMCVEYGKTYELTSLTISETTSWIVDESVRFSVPCEPVRVTSALCTRKDADGAVVSVSGSGFVLGEFYRVSVSGHPIGSPSTPSSSLHNTSFVVIAESSSKNAMSSALQLHPSEGSELKFSYSYKIVGMTNGTEDEDGVIEGGQFETPSQASLTSMSCTLKVGDPKTVEVWISGTNIPDGEYRLILKDKVSSKETELKIVVVGLSGKVEIGMFSSSSLEYGGKYEVLSLWSSLLTVALPTDATKRLLEVPEAPARVRSVSCVLADDLKTHVEVVICGENLPMGKKVSVKVLEVDSLGSTIGSEISLPSATIASKSRTEEISIEVYEVTNPSLEYGKTYEVTSLTISDTTSWIVDECVRFSVPCEPVRVKNAGCSTDQPTATVVWISGSGFMKDETYTLTLSGTPSTDPDSLDIHDTIISVVASSTTDAQSLPLPLSSTSGSSLLFGRKYSISAITNGSEAGIIDGTPSFTTRFTPTLTSISCTLKVGDPKTVEVWIVGSELPDGEYRLVLKNKVSTQEMELKIVVVGLSGKVEIGTFSSSSVMEYGGKYEVLSLWSSLLTVALPTDATKRLLEVPEAPARVRSVSCVLADDLKTHVEVVICGENLPMGKKVSVKVLEVDALGSTIGSEISLPSATIASKSRTEGISIEVYEVTNPSLEYGKTYEVTSLTISDTTSWIVDECVRFSVPCDPVRVTSALCTRKDPDGAVVSVSGSGFVLGEFYRVSVSGHPIGSPSTPSSSLHNTSFVVIAESSSKNAMSSALQLHSSEGSELKFSYSYKIVGMTNGTEDEDGVIEGGEFETPSQASLTSMSCTLKVGDPKTVEVWISGTNIPDGEYRLILKDKVSSKETELKIVVVGLSGKVEIGMFSSSSLEYGGKYEVLSLWSSLLTVALPTDATKRLLEVPQAPARVRSVSCVLAEDLKTHVEVVICGENLPMGKKVSVKVLEVGSSGSTIGSEIGLPSTTIASKSRTEGISIEVYEVTNPSLEYGKTYELTSLTISETTSWIVDESVRFSVPGEPVRVKNAGCSTDQPTATVVWILGSGLIQNETYTLTLSGKLTTDPDSSDVHDTSISVVASSSTDAKSAALPLSSTSSSSLLFDHKYTITAITNGSEAGIIDGTPSFTTRSTPKLTSLSCKLKVGDAKTAEISIIGTHIPDGLYNLVLKNTVSTKETELKITIVDSSGKAEIEIFSSSSLEYGGKYEVLSLWSSSLTVALPTDATKRLLEVPQAPARVRSVSCVLAEDLKTHVEVVICGENLLMGKKVSVKVLEVGSSGSTIGSEISLPSATIASKSRTEGISIEVYDADELCVEYGKTYELTSLTISDTTSWIVDECVRFSVPCEPVRVTSASSSDDDSDWTTLSVRGSGFIEGAPYTLTLSGKPTTDPDSSGVHETSISIVATAFTKAKSAPLQLHPAKGSQLKFSYSYSIVGISYGSVEGVVHSVVFETQDDIKRDEALITKIETVLGSSLNTSVVIEVSGTNLPSETVGKLTLDASFSFDVSFSSSSFGQSTVIELGVSGSLGFGSEYEITSLEDSNKQPIQFSKPTIVSTPSKPSQLSLCVCGNEERGGLEMSGADPETCTTINSAWNTATSLGILDTTMRIVDSADLSSPLIVTNRVTFNLISFQAKPATLRASPSSSQPISVLVSVVEGAECRLTLLTISADLSVSTFKLVSASKGTVVIQYCSIAGTRHSESNSEDVSICGWSSGLIELIETDTELNGVTMKEIEVGGIWMRGGKLNITKCDFSQNGPSIADFPSARQNIHCEGEGTISIDKQTTDETDSMWLDADECSLDGRESIVASPLFVPTLNSTESKVETDKNGKQTVKVVGTTLMPCGLSLEVFEWDSSKSIEGKSELVVLSASTATHWNETEIIIPISEIVITNLTKTMEWRGRLVFGNGVRTSNWMVVSGLGSGNKSLGGTESKWWIPVIISLSCALLVSLVIIVCVCLLRKRRSNQKALLSSEEMSPAQVEFDEKMEENDPITNPPNSALSSLPSVNDKQGTLFGETRFANEEGIPPAQSFLEVIVCNESMERSVALETDTLYNALHNPHSTRFVEKRKVSQAIAKGLVSLVEMKVIADVLTHLSPHWVLFDQNDRVSLKTREMQSVLGETGLGEEGKKMSEDGQRWMAPEVLQEGWKLTKENADHGAVFSLGLVLWELETGSVPFGKLMERQLSVD
ncbi:hypothetical protein BLNAU_9792 [Blattamonas nauphoetae]|uniref:Protein kinase domain-containing protein n=1 Tax=Blattamonas nauphoetae TaxID=2049346 RepID=A0ABQ9XUT7_9EUKA|nr:hypothetical protein BLNAU_9792 [Blattamonas nauphoetae]